MKYKNLGSGYHKIELNKREKRVYYRVTKEIRDKVSGTIHSQSVVEEIFSIYRKGKK
jgi:hypothetical protein